MTSPRDGGRHASSPRRAREPERDRDTRTLPRAFGLTTLSALLPGLGLLGTRARLVGVVGVVLALGLLGWVLAQVLGQGLTQSALATAASTGRLEAIVVALVVGTLLWVALVALTAVMSRPRGTTRLQAGGLAGFTALLCLAVAAPAAVGVRYIDAHLDAVDKVFGQGTTEGGSVFGPATDVDADQPWADIPFVNVLLLGSDAGDNREGVRTDTMIVASINTRTGDSVLLSIPRNLQNVPVPSANPLSEAYPDGYDCGSPCLMNGIWAAAEEYAAANPDRYADDPTPGMTATREVLEAVIGQPIHQTVIINLRGFSDLIDAMGGVTIKVQERLPMGGQTWTDANGASHLIPGTENGWLEPGVQKLNGYQALSYSRSRITTDDFSRMRRQRCMVAAVVDQVDPMTMLRRYPQIIGAVGDNVTTDIAQGDLPRWAELVTRVQEGTIRSLPFTATNTDVADPNFSEIRSRVYEAIHVPPAPKKRPATTPDDDAATTTATPDDAPATATPDGDAPATSTAPDELEEIGTVCD